jgi:hypothetical protein
VFELNRQIVQANGSAPSVGVNHHACRNRSCEAEVVRGSEAINQHADLITSSQSINDLAIVGHGRPLRQPADPERVVEAAVNASEPAGVNEPLKRLVNGVSTAEVEEIKSGPDLSRWGIRDSVRDQLLKIDHVRYLYTNFGQTQAPMRPIYVYKYRTARRDFRERSNR